MLAPKLMEEGSVRQKVLISSFLSLTIIFMALKSYGEGKSKKTQKRFVKQSFFITTQQQWRHFGASSSYHPLSLWKISLCMNEYEQTMGKFKKKPLASAKGTFMTKRGRMFFYSCIVTCIDECVLTLYVCQRSRSDVGWKKIDKGTIFSLFA
jgi:hypothetical protein